MLFLYHNSIKFQKCEIFMMKSWCWKIIVTFLVQKHNPKRTVREHLHSATTMDVRVIRYTTLATLNHIELQFKDLCLGTRLFGKCPTSRESPKLPVLSINNNARAIIILKNVIHYRARQWTYDPVDVPSCGLVNWGRQFDARECCWWCYHLRPPPLKQTW